MVSKVIQRGFGAGEITPSLFARTDLNQYSMGSRKLENFVVLPQGAIRTRAGFRFVGQVRIAQYRITQFVLGDHLVYN